MDLKKLPEALEDVVLDYVLQIEHSLKFKKCLDTIKTLRITRVPVGCIRHSSQGYFRCEYTIKNDKFVNCKCPINFGNYMYVKVPGRVQNGALFFNFWGLDNDFEV